MKKILLPIAAVCVAVTLLLSCNKEAKTEVASNDQISQEVLSQIKALGFGTSSVQKHEDGYLVEGDIILTPEFLKSKVSGQLLSAGQEEQYRTTNLVTGLPRTIKVALDSKLAALSGYASALTEMVNRYNALKLQLNFQVVNSGATITMVTGHGSYLASSGFPSSTGQPYSQVKVNSQAIGSGTSSTFINYLATILAHEVGHCIGFRHTDYMDRSFSCGGSPTNEGASTVGAIHIPNTPTGPDKGSWMLACIGSGQNRPFNTNDKTALNYLY